MTRAVKLRTKVITQQRKCLIVLKHKRNQMLNSIMSIYSKDRFLRAKWRKIKRPSTTKWR